MSLGTGAKKGWWGACASMRHSREVSMVTLWVGTSGACGHQHRHTEETSVEILTLHRTYLRQTSNKGGRGRVENCLQNTVATPSQSWFLTLSNCKEHVVGKLIYSQRISWCLLSRHVQHCSITIGTFGIRNLCNSYMTCITMHLTSLALHACRLIDVWG